MQVLSHTNSPIVLPLDYVRRAEERLCQVVDVEAADICKVRELALIG